MELLMSDEPSDEREAAGWLLDLPDAHRTVSSCVPAGFARYARILHPAQVGPRDATWAEVATWSDQRLTPDSNSDRLMVRDDGQQWDGQPGHARPDEGAAGLGEARLRRLYELLAAATDTPEHLWLLINVIEYTLPRESRGYAPASHGVSAPLRSGGGAKVRQMRELERRFGVFVGGDRFILHRGAFTLDGGRWMQFPSYWWPQDRSWLVHTDIECSSTYVAGDDRLFERLRRDDLLEVVEAQPEHPLDGRP